MKKLIFAMLVMLAGCSGDYSVDLGNGYSYEHWGNNFIAHSDEKGQREVISGQVDAYLKKGDRVIAIQVSLETGGEKYYLLNVADHSLDQFTDYPAFTEQTERVGFSKDELAKLKAGVVKPML